MSFNIFSLPPDIQRYIFSPQLELSDMGRLCLVNKDSQSAQFITNYFLGCQPQMEKEIEQFQDNPVVESMSSRFQVLCNKLLQTPSIRGLKELGWFRNFLFNVKRNIAVKAHIGEPWTAKNFNDSFFSSTRRVIFNATYGGLYLIGLTSGYISDCKDLDQQDFLKNISALTVFGNYLYLGKTNGQIHVFEIDQDFQELKRIKIVGCDDLSTRIERMKVEGNKLVVVKSKIEGEVVKWLLDILPADLTQAENSLDDSLKLDFESAPNFEGCGEVAFGEEAVKTTPVWVRGARVEFKSCSKSGLTMSFVTKKENPLKLVTCTYIIDINSRTARIKDSTDVDFSQNSIITLKLWAHEGRQCELEFGHIPREASIAIKDYTASQICIWMQIADEVGLGELEMFHRLLPEEKNQIYAELFQHHSATVPNFHTNDPEYGKQAFFDEKVKYEDKKIAIYNCVLRLLTNRERKEVLSCLSSGRIRLQALPLQWFQADANQREWALRPVTRHYVLGDYPITH